MDCKHSTEVGEESMKSIGATRGVRMQDHFRGGGEKG